MLYLIDEPMANVGFRTAEGDDEAIVVLIQDGVLLDPGDFDRDPDAPTYAVARDVEVRGVDLPDGVEPIPYDSLVEMVFEREVRSFV